MIDLDRLDWPALAGELARAAGPERVDDALATAAAIPGESLGWIDRTHVAFARCVELAPWALIPAVYEGGPELDRATEAVDIGRWIARVSTEALGAVRSAPPAQPAPFTAGEGLTVAPELWWLPLQPLAVAVAGTQPDGRLHVHAGELDRSTAGQYAPRPDGATITLDLTKHDTAADVCGSWAHELAHAVDPIPATRGLPRAEAFAEQLGPLLLEHRPRTLTAAQPFMAAVFRSTLDLLQPAGARVAAVVEFARLDLGPTFCPRTPLPEAGGVPVQRPRTSTSDRSEQLPEHGGRACEGRPTHPNPEYPR